ncbi:bifunctional folylpolyglutamate synthase/dihydrofolate synthase [Mesoplasma coleopterae]|uniref:Folylpolyglutamate synthase n=1 Tax=Mesoplasma coleopterae TaxID=324078 RepID=A0A2K8P1M2_9MOLU|nr:Mur ligase family protein [Mesoplasma coleopterae]ATZ20586.1 folylpolyglutamate synthase [Mesoplasma coleopterae]AVN62106.1 dihydrofolate synthase [Mesoplasma coleopterae]AVN62770.1 dihydrofolate synthase [Mesoplasma coleopterae]
MISVDNFLIPIQQRFQNEYNLDKVLKLLNNIEKYIPVVNVVGTNGKGSTSFFLSKGLKTKYKKVGLFISPAFLYHNERIQINNQPISDENLKKYISKVDNFIKEYKLTFFEIWTLIAIMYFYDNQVDIAVIEAGIGGLKDSTNLFTNQIATILTSVSFDHTEILGNTIEKIIYQKVNIAKDNTLLFISLDNAEYKNIIENSITNDVKIVYANKYDKEKIEYQRGNKGVVKAVLEFLGVQDFSCLKLTSLAGRFTKLEYKNKKIIIDGAHNVDGIKGLISSVENKNEWRILYGAIDGKEHSKILNLLDENFNDVSITTFDFHKAWDINKIDHENKVKDWKEFIESSNKNLIICGSLYFIPLVYKYLIEK